MVALPTPVVSDEGNGPRNGSAMPAVLEQSVPTPDPERNDEVAQKPVNVVHNYTRQRWLTEQYRWRVFAGRLRKSVSCVVPSRQARLPPRYRRYDSYHSDTHELMG